MARQTQITEFTEAFSKFDEDGDGSIGKQELGMAMRSFGQHPTDAELQEFHGGVNFDVHDFISIMKSALRKTDETREKTDEKREKVMVSYVVLEPPAQGGDGVCASESRKRKLRVHDTTLRQ